jgi:AcrR family transcriptional regulator
MARKDAVRNRSLLIDAATRTFLEDGLSASVNAIARAAGVNVATLYRHFPTKDHLVGAVLEAVLEPLRRAGDRALATDGDVLAEFVYGAIRVQRDKGGVFDALGGQPVGSLARERLRELAMKIAEPVVERAHRDGVMRPDFDAIDLLITLRMLGAAGGAQEPGKDPDRYADVVLRGLRPT